MKTLHIQITFSAPDPAFANTTAADVREALLCAYPLCNGDWITVEDLPVLGEFDRDCGAAEAEWLQRNLAKIPPRFSNEDTDADESECG